jgi:hypothetical protein
MPIRNISALDPRNLHRFLGPIVRGPIYQFLPLILSLKRKTGELEKWEFDSQIRLNLVTLHSRGLYPLLDDNDVLHDEVFQFSHKPLPSHTYHQLSFTTVDPRGEEGHTKHYNAFHLS